LTEPVTPSPAAPLRPLARPDDPAAEARVRPPSRPDGLAEPSAEVAEGATMEGALRMGRTSLIGLFSGPEGHAALLRLGTGDVVRVVQGDVAGGAVVTAIAEDALRLWQDGRETVLTMPV